MSKTIPQLATPTIPLTGGELFEASQNSVSVKVNANQLKSWVVSGANHNQLQNKQGGRAGEYYHLTQAIHDALFSASPIIGLGSLAGTNFRVDYGSGIFRGDIGGVDRFYQDNNIFMIGDTQLATDPPAASGSYLRFERGRDKITNFNQFNVNLNGVGMIAVLDYNAGAEITFLNSDQQANLYIYGSNASFGNHQNELLFESGGFGQTQLSVNASGLGLATGGRVNKIATDLADNNNTTLATVASINTGIQAASANALNQSNTYTDTQTALASANALNQSNTYTDTQAALASANAIISSNSYTDAQVLSASPYDDISNAYLPSPLPRSFTPLASASYYMSKAAIQVDTGIEMGNYRVAPIGDNFYSIFWKEAGGGENAYDIVAKTYKDGTALTSAVVLVNEVAISPQPSFEIARLTRSDNVVLAYYQQTSSSIAYLVVNPYTLSVEVPATIIDTAVTQRSHVSALHNGGFAIVYLKDFTIYINIYDKNGVLKFQNTGYWQSASNAPIMCTTMSDGTVVIGYKKLAENFMQIERFDITGTRLSKATITLNGTGLNLNSFTVLGLKGNLLMAAWIDNTISQNFKVYDANLTTELYTNTFNLQNDAAVQVDASTPNLYFILPEGGFGCIYNSQTTNLLYLGLRNSDLTTISTSAADFVNTSPTEFAMTGAGVTVLHTGEIVLVTSIIGNATPHIITIEYDGEFSKRLKTFLSTYYTAI